MTYQTDSPSLGHPCNDLPDSFSFGFLHFGHPSNDLPDIFSFRDVTILMDQSENITVEAFEVGTKMSLFVGRGFPDFSNLLVRVGGQILPNANYKKTDIGQIRPYTTYGMLLTLCVSRFCQSWEGGHPYSANPQRRGGHQ